MQAQKFRSAVLAAVLAMQAQGRIVPTGVRRVSQRAAHRAMRWLDDRRARRDEGSVL